MARGQLEGAHCRWVPHVLVVSLVDDDQHVELEKIIAILKERATEGRADPLVVATVAADLENCRRIALCQP